MMRNVYQASRKMASLEAGRGGRLEPGGKVLLVFVQR